MRRMSETPSQNPENPGAIRPVRASYLICGVNRENAFAALSEVERFTEWAHGLLQARILNSSVVEPGAEISFALSAAGLKHKVVGTVTRIEAPRLLEWRYTSGAIGSGGWLLEEAGADAVRITFSTDYEIHPAWINRIAHRPFFRNVAEDLLRRSIRRFGEHLKKG